MEKTAFIILILCANIILGQDLDSARYAFVNEKIQDDSLSEFPLNRNIASIDTSCYVQEFHSTDYKDTVFQFFCGDLGTLLTVRSRVFDKVGIGTYIDSSMIIEKFQKIYKNGVLNSVSVKLDSSFRKQITTFQKKRKWDKDKLYSQELYLRKWIFNRKNKGSYTMTNPIFFDNMNKAVIFVSNFYGPSFARGYAEYYEKDENGKWEKVLKFLTWMT
ncbi:MAG: hypothetical protein RI562_11945 [Salibacter sp.]|uniref:hypothetical protein n=1 Tax=Salibacter sp. TaxID=2010995 RepID=UPI00286FBFD2|nr:hypothetical protein [Salibacter sp.]MDR9399766.1 hypothetical protein [Salibacter sp.]